MPVDGGHLWADDTGGDGPVLVLLHPGWGDSSIWLPVLDRLPSHYRVIRYDTRGFGKSPAPAAPFSQLGDLAVVLDHRGADRVMLAGHSGGGGTAIGLALADPARVRGAADSYFRLGDYERPDPPAYGRLGQIQIPAAVVVGDHEYPMVARCAADIATRIPRCQQIAAPGADHLLPLRVPDMIAELVSKLDGQDRRGGGR